MIIDNKVIKRIKSIKSRKTLPILENICIKDNRLYFTNLDVSYSETLEAESGLYKLIEKELIKDNSDIEDFPVIDFSGEIICNLNFNDFFNHFKKAYTVSCLDEERFNLCSVCLTITDDKILITGTDGRRLYQGTLEGKGHLNGSYIIPNSKDIYKLLNNIKSDNDIKIFIGKDYKACFIVDDIKIYFSLIEGRYPNTDQIISRFNNNNNFKTVTFSKKEVLNYIKNTLPYYKYLNREISHDRKDKGVYSQVYITIYDSNILLSNLREVEENKSLDCYRKKDSFPALINDEAIKFYNGFILMPMKNEEAENVLTINIDYLNEIIKNIDNDNIKLSYIDKSSMFFIR